MECEMLECQFVYIKHLNFDYSKTYICRHMVNQHPIILNLYSISNIKILATKFVTGGIHK